MAKVTYNTAIGEVRGAVDRWVFRKVLGRTVVSPLPSRSKRVRTGAEAAAITRFRQAARAAKSAPPEMIARYDERARQENKSKYSIRTRDYMIPPRISAVYLLDYTGQPGQAILVIARDDFEVKAVNVAIRLADGTEVETGEATRCAGDVFRYVAQTAVPPGTEVTFEVTATDWPENVTPWQSTMVVSALKPNSE